MTYLGLGLLILVGGASRTPLVHQLLNDRLGRMVHSEVDPDLCVAMGAAVQGGLIGGVDVGPVLVDITPHTLGIQALGSLHGMPSVHHFASIIERNTPLPASRSELFEKRLAPERQEERVGDDIQRGKRLFLKDGSVGYRGSAGRPVVNT